MSRTMARTVQCALCVALVGLFGWLALLLAFAFAFIEPYADKVR